MATKAFKQEFSAGARYERKALRTYLKRKIHAIPDIRRHTPPNLRIRRMSRYQALCQALTWVRGRQSRYDKRKGGL